MDSGDESALLSSQVTDGEGTRQIPQGQAARAALVTRLLVGLLVSGSGELLQRLEELQEEVLTDSALVHRDRFTQPATGRDALWHLAIALLLRGQRRVTDGMRSGRERSVGAVRWAVRTLDRLTDNPVGRPMRRPIARRLRQWERQVAFLIEEGEIEEEISRTLAAESIGVIVDEIVDLVAENPELDRLVAEIVGQKSVGLATVMADNARTLTATGDDVAEGALRRLLRRPPRQALPPSPVEGRQQTMYRAEVRVEGGDQGDG